MPAQPELALLRETLTGQYRIEAEIGRGGMGIVFLAQDITLARRVAIKTLPAHLASDPAVRERFLREARTAAALAHPNIVPIHRAEEIGELVFFVMGFVEGESVAQRLRSRGPFGAPETVAILSDVAQALGYAHARGVIHRDIKAENILLDTAEDRAMVTDFGIARVAETAPMTSTGQVLGTVHYMSPEQIAGHAIDGRSDLYALGVLAFLMTTGRFPFEHEIPSAVLVAHVTRPAPPVRSVAPSVPSALAEIIDRLLAKAPATRPATAGDLLAALHRATPRLGDPLPAAEPVRLSATDAQQVWERAALLQEMTGQVVPPPLPSLPVLGQASTETTGLAMDDVVAAAAGAGIDRRYVDRAIAERLPGESVGGELVRPGAGGHAAPGRWTGARGRLEYEAFVPGELDDDGLEEMVDEMRRLVGTHGSVTRRSKTVELVPFQMTSNGMPGRRLQVVVTSRAGRTVIRAAEDYKATTYGVLGGVTGGVGGGLGAAAFGGVVAATQSLLLGLPVFGLVAGGAFLFARAINQYIDKDKDVELQRTVARLAARVQELVPEGLGAAPSRRRLGA